MDIDTFYCHLMKSFKLLFFSLLHFVTLHSFSQTIDPNFNLPIPVKAADVYALKVQPDDKILLGGNIQFYENRPVNNFIRLNEDGTLDESFIYDPDPKKVITEIELLSNREIIASELNKVAVSEALIKLSASGEQLGSIDSLDNITSIRVQDDDKILVSASTFRNGNLSHGLYRFNSDFTLDNSFDQTHSFSGSTLEIALQGERILVAGFFSDDDENAKSDIVRFEPDGSPDQSFRAETDISWIDKMTVQPDEKILLSATVRLNADGSRDTSFNGPQEITLTRSKTVLQGTDILIVGKSFAGTDSSGNYLYRIQTDGSLDASFTPTRLRSSYCGPCLALTSSGDILVNDSPLGGNEYGLTKFDGNGQLNTGFNPAIGTYGEISFGDYHNGQLIVGGDFVRIGEAQTRNLAKINADGNVDSKFVAAPSLSAYPVMNQQPSDVKIADANTFFVALGERLVKLDERGEVTEEYTYTRPGFTGPLNFSEKTNLLSDGRIVTASVNGIVLLNSKGTVDSSFVLPWPNAGSSLYDFDAQSTGFVWSNSFTQVNGVNVNGLVKLEYDGTVDQTFDVGSGANNIVTNVNVLENDDILLTGRFDQFNGVAARRLVKLFKNGQVDKEFTKNYSTTTPEYYFSFSSNTVNTNFRDGFIISARDWYGYTLGFLNGDGTFNPECHLPDVIKSVEEEILPIVIDADSMILFSRFQMDGELTPTFALRLIFNGEEDQVTSVENSPSRDVVRFYPNPVSNQFHVEADAWRGGTIRITNSIGRRIATQQINSKTTTINLEGINSGMYIVRLSKGDHYRVIRVIKK